MAELNSIMEYYMKGFTLLATYNVALSIGMTARINKDLDKGPVRTMLTLLAVINLTYFIYVVNFWYHSIHSESIFCIGTPINFDKDNNTIYIKDKKYWNFVVNPIVMGAIHLFGIIANLAIAISLYNKYDSQKYDPTAQKYDDISNMILAMMVGNGIAFIAYLFYIFSVVYNQDPIVSV